MRTTIDLPDHLHQTVKSFAQHTGRTLSEAATELMERGLEARVVRTGAEFATHPSTGLPQVRSAQPVTAEDVAALDNDA